MRLTCPACNAEMSLEAAVAREADARALADFISRNVPLGVVLVQYLALFRPAKRRLSFARLVALFDELQSDLARGAINRKGRDWPAPLAVWRAAMEQVLATRDKGGLSLPLTSHGYLFEVVCGLADKAEGLAEREREQQQRGRAHTGGPAAIADALAGLHGAPAAGMPTTSLPTTSLPTTTQAPSPAPADPAAVDAARRRLRDARSAIALNPLPLRPQAADAGNTPPTGDPA